VLLYLMPDDDHDTKTSLLSAAYSGDMDKLNSLTATDVNERDHLHSTALHKGNLLCAHHDTKS